MDKVVLVEGVKWEQPAGPRELNALRKSPVSLTPFSTLFVPLMWSNQFVSIFNCPKLQMIQNRVIDYFGYNCVNNRIEYI